MTRPNVSPTAGSEAPIATTTVLTSDPPIAGTMIGLGSACHPLEPTRVIAQVTERLRADSACMIGPGGRGDMSATIGLLKASTLPRSGRGELGGD